VTRPGSQSATRPSFGWSSRPVVGALLIFATGAPFELLNIVAGVVYALAMPLVALTTAYVYFDAIVRERLEPYGQAAELPSELAGSR
jgi:hypothetical protein